MIDLRWRAALPVVVVSLACAGGPSPTEPPAWTSPELVAIPGGTFQMGRMGDQGAEPHEVTLSSFLIMKREVTVGEWRAAMGDAPLGNGPCGADGTCPPVQGVSWAAAAAFANAASRLDGLNPAYTVDGARVTWDRSANGYRLPTEAEWEYAARGPSPDAWTPDLDPGWYQGNSDQPQPACQKAPNGYGLCDMLGNVSELVFDAYAPWYPKGAQVDPVVEDDRASAVVVRGGGWSSTLQDLDVGQRRFKPREDGGALMNFGVGLRLARSAP